MSSLLLVPSSLKSLPRESLHLWTGGGTSLGPLGRPEPLPGTPASGPPRLRSPPAARRVVGRAYLSVQSIPVCLSRSSKPAANLKQSWRSGEKVVSRDFGKSRSFNWVLSRS